MATSRHSHRHSGARRKGRAREIAWGVLALLAIIFFFWLIWDPPR